MPRNSNILKMSEDKLSFRDEFERYAAELTDENIENMDWDQLMEARKKLNPYGRTIEGSDCYVNMSVTHIHAEYLKKMYTTALVGFLFRMCDEWKVPKDLPVVPVDEYLRDPSKIEIDEKTAEYASKSLKYDYEFNKKWMEKRLVVFEFLEEFFQFNPDEHVRSAYRPNRADAKRSPVDTAAGKLAAEHLCKTDRDFRTKEIAYQTQKKMTALENSSQKSDKTTEPEYEIHMEKIVGKDGQTKLVKRKVRVTRDENAAAEPIRTYTNHLSDSLNNESNTNSPATDPLVGAVLREYIPPHDMFGKFGRYVRDNYEQVREATKDLYGIVPDIELAVNPYSYHTSLEDAEAFKKKHAKEVITEVFTLHSGKWNFIDCFKKQRDSTQFFTEDTIVLEEMLKQLERDERLGADLMKKQKKIAKTKNIIEAGPHAESFETWKKNNPFLHKMQQLGQKTDEDLADEDAIEVPVWRIAKGGRELTRTKFYTQAEAPSHASAEVMGAGGLQGEML